MDRSCSFVVLYLSVYLSGSVATQPPSVTLPDGTEVLGTVEHFDSEMLGVSTDIELFFGIPYAEAPVGSLRFKPPVPKKLQSPFNANKIGNACLQTITVESFAPKSSKQSEDCLFLDVLVPRGLTEPAPVLVWIHGGAFIFGAGQMSVSESLALVAFGEIIMVTINYRLGALGFLNTGDGLIPGNLGLRDQQFALKWVRENIKAFGGDPSQVTIIGESAGSVSVMFQVLSPGSRGLFKNAIMQSGSLFDPWVNSFTPEYHRLEVETLAKLLGCSNEDIQKDEELLDCLQKAPVEDVNVKLPLAQRQLNTKPWLPVSPVVDGDSLPEDPLSLLQNGAINVKNLIVGTNAEEGTFLTFSHFFKDPEVKPHINASIFRQGLKFIGIDEPSLRQLTELVYIPDPGDLEDDKDNNFFVVFNQLLGDYYFMCGESKFSRMAASFANVYRYTMTFQPSNNVLGMKWAGASHADEIQYVFGAPFQERMFDITTDEERELSRRTMQYWLNFIRSGNPNHSSSNSNHHQLPEWPKFTTTDEIFKDLSSTMDGNVHMKQRECYLLETILPPLQEAFNELKALREKSSKWSKEGQCEDDHCEIYQHEP